MRLSLVRLRSGSALILGLALLGTRASAQAAAGRPSQAEANVLLQDPGNIAKVRQQLEQSGLTPDQIRARLLAAGYSESTLDAFMPGSHDSLTAPSADVFKAVRALGIMDSTTISGMARPAPPVVPAPAPPPPEDPSFRVFGRDVFARSTTQFDPAASGPVDDNYIVGPGDQGVVVLTGDVEQSYPVPVNREGFIVFPNSGAIPVQGHTVREVRAQLFARLGKAYSGLKPDNKGTTQMLFTISKRGIIQVRVAGDVVHPGLVDVSNSSSILAGLYQAGGPNDEGSMRAVQLKRGNQTVGTMDLYDYLTTGNTNSDLIVESNDVIFVPTRGARVRITGAVMRPMTYEVKPGETLRDVVKLAGGFTPAADRRRLQIARILPPAQRTESGRDRVIRDIMDPALDTGFGPATELQPDDVIIVGSVDAHTAGQVIVHGNVWSVGSVAFAPGMRLSEALRRAGGLKSDSYLAQVNISRLQPDSTRVLIRAALQDTLGNSANDLALAENDEIEVFSVTLFRPNRYVAITGAVRKNGQYPYREGMTLRDLALEAGGLQEGALLTHAEIARLPADRTNGKLATTIIVPLDSFYLFDRGPDGKSLGPPGIQGAPRSPEVVLQPYDYVLINTQPDWALQHTVVIGGEVPLPGTYAIKSKDERIRDIIARAGGLEPGAYASGVTLIRKGVGRIGIDLPTVLRDSTNVDNLLVVDGDQIFIPPYSGVVTVHGEVYSPVSVAYVDGASADYYIRAAGGSTTKADLNRLYVTQANGKVEATKRLSFFRHDTPVPQPGSVIVVPTKDQDKKSDWGSIATATLSTMGSLVAIVAIIRR